MKKIATTMCILGLMSLWSCGDQEPCAPAQSRELTLVLNISDAAGSRAAADAEKPSSDLEKINTLRVIIARPNGEVEANRLIVPLADGWVSPDDIQFSVQADEDKTVYLIGNEASIPGADFGSVWSLDLDALDNPAGYPGDMASMLVGGFEPGNAVPMTAVYRLSASMEHAKPISDDKYVISYNLGLLRTMVKFTFNIINRRTVPISLSGVGIDNIAAESYYLFPRVNSGGGTVAHYLTVSGSASVESGTGQAPEYSGGSNASADISYTDYFRGSYAASEVATAPHYFISNPIEIAPGSSQKQSFYYYESNSPSSSNPQMPYKLMVNFEDHHYMQNLENLPSLPRNTHVVVNLTFNNSDKPFEVEVLPYESVALRPGFGSF